MKLDTLYFDAWKLHGSLEGSNQLLLRVCMPNGYQGLGVFTSCHVYNKYGSGINHSAFGCYMCKVGLGELGLIGLPFYLESTLYKLSAI